MRPRSRRTVLRAACAGLGTALAGCGLGGSSPEDQVLDHREALSSYTDVSNAISDGYQMTTPYLRSDEGVVGLQFVNLDTPELDPERPQVLFYDLLEDGAYELLGVKWLVPTDDADSPPSMFGREFDGPMQDESVFVPEHYGLHAWVFEDNPDGVFARYHPAVDPPSYIDDLDAAWSAFDPYFANEAAAEEDGYTNTEECVSTGEGVYGIPFVDTASTGSELTEPSVLLYRLTATWTYQMVGAEWYVPADGVDTPPTMFGREFEGPMEDHSPEFDQGEHYGLHAWLYVANPDGMFAPYNPALEC